MRRTEDAICPDSLVYLYYNQNLSGWLSHQEFLKPLQNKEQLTHSYIQNNGDKTDGIVDKPFS